MSRSRLCSSEQYYDPVGGGGEEEYYDDPQGGQEQYYNVPPGGQEYANAQGGEEYYDDNGGGDEQQHPEGLVLDDIESQMAQLRSKYPTSESDYLSAARARNAARVQSQEQQATEDDWKQAQYDAQQRGALVDDWDNSLSEAGNADSQIIIPMDGTVAAGEGGEDGEEDPQLLLF